MYNHIAFVIRDHQWPIPAPHHRMVKTGAYRHWLTGLPCESSTRSDSRGDVDRKALQASFEALDNGLPLTVAPEGTRSRSGKLLEGQPGLAYLAAQTGVPIVPVAFSGSDRWSHNIKRLRRTTIRVRVGRPFVLAADDERLSGEPRR
jgi:1-acyl-sn-glycerol-3-phosphate acyltransferase